MEIVSSYLSQLSKEPPLRDKILVGWIYLKPHSELQRGDKDAIMWTTLQAQANPSLF